MSELERLRLIQKLNTLPRSKFAELVFALKVPFSILPSSLAPQGDRSAALVEWVEGSSGPGLPVLKEMLEQIIASTPQAINDASASTSQRNTPLPPDTLEAQGRQRYNDWLQKQIEEPMFAEAFSLSLKQVYVPLRAWYHRRKKSHNSREERYERVVVELETQLQKWLKAADSNDSIRVLSGGPGAGKSSFTKMFAACLAEEGKTLVLVVPLQSFDFTGDLIQSIGKFVSYDQYLKTNPLQLPPKEPRWLIIFDGLDELAMQDKIGKEVSQAFVQEVTKQLDRFNRHRTLLQVIISGRGLAIKDNKSEFRNPRQILHLLPHFILEEKREKENGEPYVIEDETPSDLLKDDRRQTWWQQYGTASGKSYTALPAELNQGNLVEITAQPLLNYLVALSYDPTQPGSFGPEANHNQIYRQLLDAVYERGYENNGTHKAIQKMEKKDFVEILEEVALATWHSGDSRTTTVAEIQKYCHSSNQTESLKVFKEGAEAGVTRLLMAFDFYQSDTDRDKNGIFEFTHKSFEEYLVACRIVRAIKQMQTERDDSTNNLDSWMKRQTLADWVRVCGPSPLNLYILEFLRNEIRLQPQEEVARWQKTLSRLFEFVLRHYMPMEMLELKTFREEVIQAQHAEESLLAALNACARTTKMGSNINWPSPETMGIWIARSQGQRISYSEIPLIFSCLGYLNLSKGIFIGSNLSNADLRHTNLSEANLKNTNLSEADLRHTNLSEADLKNTNLSEADLRHANLSPANLSDANLNKADLSDAMLENAFLCDANLNNATLSSTHLNKALLIDAKLGEANLSKATLIEARLDKAELKGADLSFAKLQKAKMEGVDLQSADLSNTKLSRVILANANLSGASLSRANLSHANLSSVDLSHANLHKATLSDVNLLDAYLSNAVLVGANLRGATLISADLSNANLQDSNLSNTDLSRAILSGANLSDAVFVGASLSEATLISADLSNANLQNSNLKDTNLSRAILIGADLRGAKGLTPAQIVCASHWEHALIDDALQRRLPWSDMPDEDGA